ncbi:hypothetical protein OPU71_01735 [Niveibacterium sp. 24ML]|uniref:hypothetical protein n=1 Tax=Niveibacterium sp. 24ML TaxID=2985512 RepID=UPI00226D73B2|nr:hypothetical protein [Niveibacterium sp. 24ML]MCX9154839.1 hypothetical protein [Niveibacterium sp. 24ML]
MINTPSARRYLIALVAALAMAGLGAATFSIAQKGRRIAEQQHGEANAVRDQVTGKLNAALRDEPEIRRALGRFEQLRQSGLIGSERRLEWAEATTRLRQQLKEPALDFELAPQRPLPNANNELPLQASTMTLRASLWHEGDLLRMLAVLREQRSASVLPRRCTLEREAADAGAEAPPVSVVCELDWITLGTPGPVAK